jgi:hypothetical protein
LLNQFKSLQFLNQDLSIYGLGKEIIALPLDRLQDIGPVGKGCGHEDPGPFGRINAFFFLHHPYLLECGMTVHLRHLDIKAYEVIGLIRFQRQADSINTFPAVDRDMQGPIAL